MLLLKYTSICLLFLIFTVITGHHHLLISSQSLLIHLSVSCLSPVLFPLRSQRVILKTIKCFMQISQWLSIALRIKSKTLNQALVYLPACHTTKARHTDFCPSFFFNTQSYFLPENLYNLTLTLYLPWFSFHILSNIFLYLKWSREVAQSCWTLCDPMDCSLSGSSVPGIFQARVLEWGATAFSAKKEEMHIYV